MHAYSPWGFLESPFQTTVLPPSEVGSRLLVGRDKEVALLEKRLNNPPKLVTIEGANGVGKTSLVNVAAFRGFKRHLDDPNTHPLLVPCRKSFQLSPDDDVNAFILRVMYEVAQTLIERSGEVQQVKAKLANAKAVARWLNSPMLGQISTTLGLNVKGTGGALGFGKGSNANTGDGFKATGLATQVEQWLVEIFPDSLSGGVVCVLDNLELLQTSEAARDHIEALRDRLLLIPGLRWVLCGALGIVKGVASSPRLQGHLHPPIEVGGFDPKYAKDVFESRVNEFAAVLDPYLPMEVEQFTTLYELLNRNLRAVLGEADSFSQIVSEDDQGRPNTPEDKKAVFEAWLDRETQSILNAVSSQLTPRAWEVFDKAVEFDGSFSPGDYEAFGFNSLQALRPYVRILEEVGLMVSAKDDVDRRRKTVQLTPKGWLARNGRRAKAMEPAGL